jgi:hypothetical protein
MRKKFVLSETKSGELFLELSYNSFSVIFIYYIYIYINNKIDNEKVKNKIRENFFIFFINILLFFISFKCIRFLFKKIKIYKIKS